MRPQSRQVDPSDRVVPAVCVSLILWLWVASGITAQEPVANKSFSERVDVDLVQLKVNVTDGDGRPVIGLTRDDFRIRYGGQKVEPALFSAVERAADEQTASATDAGEEPSFVLLLVDENHLDGGFEEAGVAAVADFVAGLGGEDRTMVVSAKGDELSVVQSFTRDAGEVASALRRLDVGPSPTSSAVEFRRLMDEIRRVEERPAGDGPARSLSSDELPMALRGQIEGLAQEAYRELAALTLGVDRAITAMAGLPGRRDLVLITGSLPNRVAHELNLAWNRAFGYGSDLKSRPSLVEEFGGVERLDNQAAQIGIRAAGTEELFGLLARRANAQAVTLHVVGSVGRRDGERRVDDPAIAVRMAERTGGRAVVGQNAHRVLGTVSGDLHSYYVLAFTPPQPARADSGEPQDGAPVDVEVRLARRLKNLAVAYRESVRPIPLEERAALSAVSELLLGSESATETDTGGLGLRAEVPSRAEGRDDVLRLPVVVFIPLRGLTMVETETGDRQGRVSLHFTTGDLTRGARPVQQVVLPFQLTPDQLEGLEERQIEYNIDIPMGLDSQRVAVALRDDLSGDVWTASAEIQRLRLTP
ncbi:MAG: VWA domain-containing protein [Thermoanaerobaculia bacterium]|nr:VWA domain-containing protein [Thermoanaerobaculia bacterium]